MAASSALWSVASTVAQRTPMPSQSFWMSTCGALGAVRVQPRAGMALVAGHRRRAVVEDDDHALDLVVEGVDERRDAGVEEGGVADHAHRRLAARAPC